VSLTVHRPQYRDDASFSVLLAVWGQFIDHDITATALSKRSTDGAPISCCYAVLSGGQQKHPECFPVLLGPEDPFFQQYNTSCMEFVRSAPAPACRFGPREQLNQATSFLDGSVVYGTSAAAADALREKSGGRLRMRLSADNRELLPVSMDPNDGCNRAEEAAKGRYCFVT
ncbi:Chorion peroxidase, partial [Gryllus bimaculatus]